MPPPGGQSAGQIIINLVLNPSQAVQQLQQFANQVGSIVGAGGAGGYGPGRGGSPYAGGLGSAAPHLPPAPPPPTNPNAPLWSSGGGARSVSTAPSPIHLPGYPQQPVYQNRYGSYVGNTFTPYGRALPGQRGFVPQHTYRGGFGMEGLIGIGADIGQVAGAGLMLAAGIQNSPLGPNNDLLGQIYGATLGRIPGMEQGGLEYRKLTEERAKIERDRNKDEKEVELDRSRATSEYLREVTKLRADMTAASEAHLDRVAEIRKSEDEHIVRLDEQITSLTKDITRLDLMATRQNEDTQREFTNLVKQRDDALKSIEQQGLQAAKQNERFFEDVATQRFQRERNYEQDLASLTKQRGYIQADYEKSSFRLARDRARFEADLNEKIRERQKLVRRQREDLSMDQTLGAFGLISALQSGNIVQILGAIKALDDLDRQEEDLNERDAFGFTPAERRNIEEALQSFQDHQDDLAQSLLRSMDALATSEARLKQARDDAIKAEETAIVRHNEDYATLQKNLSDAADNVNLKFQESYATLQLQHQRWFEDYKARHADLNTAITDAQTAQKKVHDDAAAAIVAAGKEFDTHYKAMLARDAEMAMKFDERMIDLGKKVNDIAQRYNDAIKANQLAWDSAWNSFMMNMGMNLIFIGFMIDSLKNLWTLGKALQGLGLAGILNGIKGAAVTLGKVLLSAVTIPLTLLGKAAVALGGVIGSVPLAIALIGTALGLLVNQILAMTGFSGKIPGTDIELKPVDLGAFKDILGNEAMRNALPAELGKEIESIMKDAQSAVGIMNNPTPGVAETPLGLVPGGGAVNPAGGQNWVSDIGATPEQLQEAPLAGQYRQPGQRGAPTWGYNVDPRTVTPEYRNDITMNFEFNTKYTPEEQQRIITQAVDEANKRWETEMIEVGKVLGVQW